MSMKGVPRVKFKLVSVLLCIISLVMACSRRTNEVNARSAIPNPQNPMTANLAEARGIEAASGPVFCHNDRRLLER
jgi:hypothetical protein